MIVSQFDIQNHEMEKSVSYFLLVTNLAEKGYSFRISLHSREPMLEQKASIIVYKDVPPQEDPYSSLSPSTPGQFKHALKAAGTHKYIGDGLFHVGAQETVHLQLLPLNVFGGPSQNLWARGHAELTIPPVGWGGGMKPQGTEPVPVLIHAYTHRYTSGIGHDDRSPIALTTGQARNEIVPSDLVRMQPSPAKWDDLDSTAIEETDTAAFVEDPASIAAVITYLGEMAKTPENVEAMNILLRDAGHDLRLAGGRD